jgi:small-conductance mechanosensitive channel
MDVWTPAALIEQAQGFVKAFWASLPQIGVALLVLLLTWLGAKLVRLVLARVCRSARMRRSLIEVLQMIGAVTTWIIGILIATVIVFPSMTPAKMLTALGLGSVAIGFAFKDVFENFLAGILLLIREPFRLGDYIDCGGVEGQVAEITIRDTHIRQTDGQRVVMPNALLFKEPVTVRTDSDFRRTTIVCGVAYGEDVDAARDVITRAVKNLDTVRDDVRDVEIFAQAFGASSIDFEVTWWTGSRPIDIRISRDQVVAAVKRALDEAGIEIPFPYRTLTFKGPLPVGLQDDRGERAAAE